MTDTTTGRRVLLMIPFTQYREEDVAETSRVLEKAGISVAIGAASARTCHGMAGGSVDAEVGLDTADPSDFDAIVLAGGSSVPSLFWKNKALIALVISMAEAGKPVAAIDLSPVVLAQAGLLQDKRAAVHYMPEAVEELKNAGARYVSEPFVIEGRVMTAEGTAAVTLLAEALRDTLTGQPAGAATT